MSSRDAATATLDTFDRLCGLDHMAVLHLNDSKGTLGSRLDRHEHIGDGEIGLEGFAAVLTHPTLRATPRPMILETPKGQTDTGIAWDTLNLEKLRTLLAAPSVKSAARAKPARRPSRNR
jgi:deoxyribonuclease-4